MSFETSPFERVRNSGLRIMAFRNALNAGSWDMAFLDTALKALEDDNGNQVLPNGVTESVTVMQRVFESLPQIMEQAHSLYDQEYKKFAPTQPAAPPQTAEVQFAAPTTVAPGDMAGDVAIAIQLDTSDAQPLETEVQVDIRDLLTGTALTPAHYTFPNPTVVTFPIGHISGNTISVPLANTGANAAPDRTINLDINPATIVGPAIVGPQGTHTVTLINIGA